MVPPLFRQHWLLHAAFLGKQQLQRRGGQFLFGNMPIALLDTHELLLVHATTRCLRMVPNESDDKCVHGISGHLSCLRVVPIVPARLLQHRRIVYPMHHQLCQSVRLVSGECDGGQHVHSRHHCIDQLQRTEYVFGHLPCVQHVDDLFDLPHWSGCGLRLVSNQSVQRRVHCLARLLPLGKLLHDAMPKAVRRNKHFLRHVPR
jgi:hypothetical protein